MRRTGGRAESVPNARLHLPDSVEVLPKSLWVGDQVCRTFAVNGYPRDSELVLGWLAGEPGWVASGRSRCPCRN